MNYLKVLLLVIVTCTISCSKYDVVPTENINKERLEFAKLISHKLLNGQKTGVYYELSNKEAIAKVIVGLDEVSQRTNYETISGMVGDYEDLAFYQMVKSKDYPLHEVYRFKGKFSGEVDIEIRATLDGYGKLAGFYYLKWKESI